MTSTALPPTSNLLDQAQRVRLMLSTRKLGQLLGSTPFMLDSSARLPFAPEAKKHLPSDVKARRRQGICHSPSSSVSSIETFVNFTILGDDKGLKKSISRPRGKTDARPPFLQLCPNTTFTLQTVSHLRRSSLPSPTFFNPSHKRSNSTPTTPVTPSFLPVPIDQPAERRKKMAKVSRTFGEPIPTQLVFPPPEPASKPTTTPERSPLPSPAPSIRSKTHRKRSSTLSPGPSPRGRLTAAFHLAPPVDSPFAALAPPEEVDVDLVIEGAQRIAQHEWTGEWNLKDMEQVQKGLRALRL